MSIGDWIAFGVVGPLILVGGWIQTYRVWRHHADVSAGVTWVTGEASTAGLHSFALPGMTGMTLTLLGAIFDLAPDGDVDPASMASFTAWFMGIGLLLILLGFWMWLFAWPRFLVPPHLRGRPGWVGALWRQWHYDPEDSKAGG